MPNTIILTVEFVKINISISPCGICQVSRTFQSQPVIYTTYEKATYFVPLFADKIDHLEDGRIIQI